MGYECHCRPRRFVGGSSVSGTTIILVALVVLVLVLVALR